MCALASPERGRSDKAAMAGLIYGINEIRRYAAHYTKVKDIFKGFNDPDCRTNGGRAKPAVSRLVDYLYLFFVMGMQTTNYHLFRFDTMDRKRFKEYMDDPNAPLLRPKLWSTLWKKSTFILVHDKYLFHCLCEYHGLPCPRCYGVVRRNALPEAKAFLKDLMQKNGMETFVLKPVWGLMGKGIHFISLSDVDALERLIEHDDVDDEYSDYLVQERIRQHPELERMNPHSVNSIRIVTFLVPEGRVEFIAAMLRTSSSASPVDNFSAGGMVAGIDLDTGALKKEGVIKTPKIRVLTRHPVTGTELMGFRVPYWEEIKETAARGQKTFHYIKSIGWDFAVTPEGPVIIEANQEWGTAGLQAANGGLLTEKNRKLFARYGLKFYE